MSNKTTKKALLFSLLSMLICIAMLAGTTFAWFTDTATSGSNRIVAGNLSVDLVKAPSYNGDYSVISKGKGNIFAAGENANETTTTLWEPGATHIAYLGVQNTGSLALKYNIYLNVTDGGLADVLEYAIVPFGKTPAEITSWTAAKSAAEKTGAVKAGNFLAAEGGCLDEVANGTQKETDYFALVVHMSETAGNDYKNKDVTIDVQINATQKDAESDSFDNQYDKIFYIETFLTNVIADVNNPTTVTASGATLKFTADTGYILPASVKVKGATSSWDKDTGTLTLSNVTDNVKITVASEACFSAGTKITMADGSLKNIEDITEGDSVLTFNHETCEYEGQKVYIAWHGEYKATAFTLHFDNGNALSIVGEHDLFEKESLQYVTICNSTAEQFIGKHFYSAADGKYVELTGVTYETEAVEFYTIHTEYNKNCIANGMLSVPIETAGSLNIYKFNENLSIDHAQLEEDIAEFGLFEYPDDATYSEEFFDAIGGKYINIIVGKGFDTLENICAEIEAFLAGEY